MRRTLRNLYYLSGKELIRLGLKRAPQYSFPDFICIGAQKSGTTWLYENLKLHPDIFMPDKKELHYFNLNYHTSLAYYNSYFEKDSNRIKGEITPAYSTL